MGCVVVALCKVFWRGSGVGALKRLACCVKGADQRGQRGATTEHHGYRTGGSTEHKTGSTTSDRTVDGIVLLSEVGDGRVSVREDASHGG